MSSFRKLAGSSWEGQEKEAVVASCPPGGMGRSSAPPDSHGFPEGKDASLRGKVKGYSPRTQLTILQDALVTPEKDKGPSFRMTKSWDWITELL